MAWTAPSTWVAGAVLTAAQLNQQLRDNMLAQTPAACSLSITALALTSTALTLGSGGASGSWTEALDAGSMHDAVTNPSRITAPITGLYMITGAFNASAGTVTAYAMVKEGGTAVAQTTMNGTATYFTRGTFTALRYVTSGTYWEYEAACATNLTVSYNFGAVYLGAP